VLVVVLRNMFVSVTWCSMYPWRFSFTAPPRQQLPSCAPPDTRAGPFSGGRAKGSSAPQFDAIKKRFVRVETRNATPLLAGGTTSIFESAIDFDSEGELRISQASNDNAGVKGSVVAKDGVGVVATSRWDVDGAAIWEFGPSRLHHPQLEWLCRLLFIYQCKLIGLFQAAFELLFTCHV